MPYPWRDSSTSPFHLLLAEMLLRQTDAPKVSRVWEELVAEAPDPASLLAMKDSRISELVLPLGLVNQRVRALKECCEVIVSQHGGQVPRAPHQLLGIPHLGLYTATAVACFAYNRRNPIVDGNILRILGRLTNQDFGLDNRRSEDAWKLAWAILPSKHYRQHNFGLLDFAANICTAQTPKHEQCVLRMHCSCFLTDSGSC